MNERLFVALWILLAIYVSYRLIISKKKKIIKYDKLDEVINNDKYKVKGQYD